MQELADLDDKTFFISNDGRQTYWLWLKQVYGFTDDQVKPYTFNPAPFLADTELGAAGLRHLRAVRDQAAGRLRARWC